MAERRPRRGLRLNDLHVEPDLARFSAEFSLRDLNALCPLGRNRKGYFAGSQHHTVTRHRPSQTLVVSMTEQIIALDIDEQRSSAHQRKGKELLGTLCLVKGGMRGAIGKHQPVEAELTIVGLIAKIAAVGPECRAVFRFFCQRLIDPVPDKAALQPGMAAECLPVAGKAAKAVTHRVGILAQDQRTGFVRHTNPLFNRPLWHRRERLILIDAGIHRANNISCRRTGPPAFVLHRPRGIGGFQPAVQRIVIRPMPGLIPQGPDDDGRMIPVPLHHTRYAFAHGRQPARIVRQAAHRHHAMGFNIRLIDHVQAVAIAKRVPQRVIRIMRAAHGIEVMLLHQFDVAAHGRLIHHLPLLRMMFMTVHAADQQRFAVKLQQAVADFDASETDIAGFSLQHVALHIPKRHGQTIAFRCFSAPQRGIVHGYRHREPLRPTAAFVHDGRSGLLRDLRAGFAVTPQGKRHLAFGIA
ncbi:Uncharacterised protein [Enterobacter hormaechei]|nr:Uncharacterised protein [Enterobacter hormaechei]SAE98951.1 Uncharacterised protein [Enterobacter hormaechei]SAH56878.1 Uncharacterised protein [Enterobacter hormaechei]